MSPFRAHQRNPPPPLIPSIPLSHSLSLSCSSFSYLPYFYLPGRIITSVRREIRFISIDSARLVSTGCDSPSLQRRKMILALCQFAARGSINCRLKEIASVEHLSRPFSTSPRFTAFFLLFHFMRASPTFQEELRARGCTLRTRNKRDCTRPGAHGYCANSAINFLLRRDVNIHLNDNAASCIVSGRFPRHDRATI